MLDRLVEALAADAPVFRPPDAVHSHIRPLMSAPLEKTLILDGFHRLDRHAEMISEKLERRGLTERVDVELVGTPTWVSVHVPRREADKRAFIGDRRGQAVRLRFAAPVTGPISLGHSSSFGLGLFRPVQA